MIRPPSYWHRLGDATSQLLNVALLNGNPNESISGRAWRSGWARVRAAIDAVLGAGHCRGAYLWDIARAVRLIETVPPADRDAAEARALQ